MTRLLVLFVTAFVDMVGLTMVIPLLPYYATDFGADATMVGFLISSFSIAQLAVAPSWGRFSDRYGRRPAILAGLLLTGASYALFAFAGSITALLVSRLIQGAGGGTIGVVQAYVADASPPNERTKSLGWLSVVTSLGAVAGPAFGSAMISLGGRRAPGIASAVLCLLVAAFAWRYLRESRELRHSASHGAPSTTTSREAILRVLTHWREPASRLIWIYTIGIGAFYGTIQTAPLLLSGRLRCHRVEHRLLRHVPGRDGRRGPLAHPGQDGRSSGRSPALAPRRGAAWPWGSPPPGWRRATPRSPWASP